MQGSSGDVSADIASFAVDAGDEAGGFEGDEGRTGCSAGNPVPAAELGLAG